jgi:hypothetical protein
MGHLSLVQEQIIQQSFEQYRAVLQSVGFSYTTSDRQVAAAAAAVSAARNAYI